MFYEIRDHSLKFTYLWISPGESWKPKNNTLALKQQVMTGHSHGSPGTYFFLLHSWKSSGTWIQDSSTMLDLSYFVELGKLMMFIVLKPLYAGLCVNVTQAETFLDPVRRNHHYDDISNMRCCPQPYPTSHKSMPHRTISNISFPRNSCQSTQ